MNFSPFSTLVTCSSLTFTVTQNTEYLARAFVLELVICVAAGIVRKDWTVKAPNRSFLKAMATDVCEPSVLSAFKVSSTCRHSFTTPCFAHRARPALRLNQSTAFVHLSMSTVSQSGRWASWCADQNTDASSVRDCPVVNHAQFVVCTRRIWQKRIRGWTGYRTLVWCLRVLSWLLASWTRHLFLFFAANKNTVGRPGTAKIAKFTEAITECRSLTLFLVSVGSCVCRSTICVLGVLVSACQT